MGANRTPLFIHQSIQLLYIATSVDPDQTARMRRLVWVYTGRKGQYIFRTPLLWKLADAHVEALHVCKQS